MALLTCATKDVAWTLRISDKEIRDLFTKLNEDMTENDIKTTIEEFVRNHDKCRSSSKDPEAGSGKASGIASVSTNQDEATEEYLSWADLWKNAKKMEEDAVSGNSSMGSDIENLVITATDSNRGRNKTYYRNRCTSANGKSIAEVFEFAEHCDTVLYKYKTKNDRDRKYIGIEREASYCWSSFRCKVAPLYAMNQERVIQTHLTSLRNTKEQPIEDYVPGLVETQPEDFRFKDSLLADQVPVSKSQTLLISGVSGSGKSWLTYYGLPLDSPESCFLYCSLPDDTEENFNSVTRDVPIRVSRAMSFLFDAIGTPPQNSDEGSLYGRVSTSAMELNKDRNQRAKTMFYTFCKDEIKNNVKLNEWWNGRGPTVKNLVVVLDECGKSLTFSRGIIDVCRTIRGELAEKKIAHSTKLVLAYST